MSRPLYTSMHNSVLWLRAEPKAGSSLTCSHVRSFRSNLKLPQICADVHGFISPCGAERHKIMQREYPDRPIVGVGAIIVEQGRVLLARRGNPPRAGQWSLPGGAVELGETL